MGLFSRLLGSKDKLVTPTFELTEEEKWEVDKMFGLLKDYYAPPSVADKLKQGLTARGLANYAADQIMNAELLSQSAEREISLNKAIAAIGKAYSIYPLPIYLYDLACYFELKDMRNEAKEMYERFLTRQAEYKIEQLDQIFLGDRNIDEAKVYASQKLREE